MDRAHRIGQTKSVNVYRLITLDTLEEQIMDVQMFKTKAAKDVLAGVHGGGGGGGGGGGEGGGGAQGEEGEDGKSISSLLERGKGGVPHVVPHVGEVQENPSVRGEYQQLHDINQFIARMRHK